MKERDVGALIAGIVLGFLSTYLVFVAAKWFAHVGMFIIVSLLFPLFVSLVAGKRIVLIGLVPNLVMTLCLSVYFLVLSPDVHGFEVIYIIAVMLGMSILLALLVSVPIHLLRKKQVEQQEVDHVFSRDS
jgi:hypothetical protein